MSSDRGTPGATSPDHQEEPDPQEEAGLGSPEPFQHSRGTLQKAHSSDSGAEPARLDASNSDVAGEADMFGASCRQKHSMFPYPFNVPLLARVRF